MHLSALHCLVLVAPSSLTVSALPYITHKAFTLSGAPVLSSSSLSHPLFLVLTRIADCETTYTNSAKSSRIITTTHHPNSSTLTAHHAALFLLPPPWGTPPRDAWQLGRTAAPGRSARKEAGGAAHHSREGGSGPARPKWKEPGGAAHHGGRMATGACRKGRAGAPL